MFMTLKTLKNVLKYDPKYAIKRVKYYIKSFLLLVTNIL